MGQVLHRGRLQGREPVGVAVLRGWRLVSEGDRWGFGEDMETFPEDPFETVKARIVGGDEKQVVGVSRWTGGVWVMETTG